MMLPKVESVPVTDELDRHGCYHVEPLETGFGQTLGNALRRVLLSSLPGAAITSIKIEDVYHEFSAIPFIKEDVTEFVLNIKQVRLRSFSDQPVLCRIEVAAGGVVTAADIICPPDVEIVNPEQVLATLNGPEARLSIELTVDRGRGYSAFDQREELPIGVIPVDAIFTPIRKVNYKVEPTRVGQETHKERLVLDVWSDGTVGPDEAVATAAKILISHFDLVDDALSEKPASGPIKPLVGGPGIPTKLYDTPIEDLDLTVRAYNCLKRAGITKVGQVLEMTEDDLLGVRNFGRKSLDELRERLSGRGLLDLSKLKLEAELSAESDEEIDEIDDESFEPELAELDDEPVVTASVLVDDFVVVADDEIVIPEPVVEVPEPAPATSNPDIGRFEDFEEEDEGYDGGGHKSKKRRRDKETKR